MQDNTTDNNTTEGFGDREEAVDGEERDGLIDENRIRKRKRGLPLKDKRKKLN